MIESGICIDDLQFEQEVSARMKKPHAPTCNHLPRNSTKLK